MYNEAIDLLKSEIVKNPQNGELHYQLGIVYLDMEEENLANTSFERSIEIDKKYKNKLSNEFFNRAMNYYNKGIFPQAGKLFESAISYDSTITKKIFNECYSLAKKYLIENNYQINNQVAEYFYFTLYFCDKNEDKNIYIELNSILSHENNLLNILKIDSLNIYALSSLININWRNNEYENVQLYLKKLREKIPLEKEWISVQSNVKFSENIIFTTSDSVIAKAQNKNDKDLILYPYQISNYNRKDENNYILDYSGNVYETKKGWINWIIKTPELSNTVSIEYYQDGLNLLPDYLKTNQYKNKIARYNHMNINLFSKLPEKINIKKRDAEEYIGYELISTDYIKDKKITSFTGNIKSINPNYIKTVSWDPDNPPWLPIIEFHEVTYECCPKWVESVFYIPKNKVCKGVGNIDWDRITFVSQLTPYSDNIKDKILNNNITKNLTTTELSIALGARINDFKSTNETYKDNIFQSLITYNNMEFNFENGLLKNWKTIN